MLPVLLAGGLLLAADYATRPVLLAGPLLQKVEPDGFTVVDLSPDALHLRQINRLGQVVDDWTCARRPTSRPAGRSAP